MHDDEMDRFDEEAGGDLTEETMDDFLEDEGGDVPDNAEREDE